MAHSYVIGVFVVDTGDCHCFRMDLMCHGQGACLFHLLHSLTEDKGTDGKISAGLGDKDITPEHTCWEGDQVARPLERPPSHSDNYCGPFCRM